MAKGDNRLAPLLRALLDARGAETGVEVADAIVPVLSMRPDQPQDALLRGEVLLGFYASVALVAGQYARIRLGLAEGTGKVLRIDRVLNLGGNAAKHGISIRDPGALYNRAPTLRDSRLSGVAYCASRGDTTNSVANVLGSAQQPQLPQVGTVWTDVETVVHPGFDYVIESAVAGNALAGIVILFREVAADAAMAAGRR